MLNHFLAIETAGPLHTPSHWLIRYHDVVLMVFGMVGFLADSFLIWSMAILRVGSKHFVFWVGGSTLVLSYP